MPESHSFGVEPISCHSWNKDRSRKFKKFLMMRINNPNLRSAIFEILLNEIIKDAVTFPSFFTALAFKFNF